MDIKETAFKRKQGEKIWEVIVGADDAKGTFNKIVKEAKKYANIPGFRKGKVPESVLIKKFSRKYFESEALKEILMNAFKKLRELDNNFISEDISGEIKFNENGFVFNITTFYLPELEKEDYEGLEISYEKIEFKEDIVDQTIEGIRNKLAVLKEVNDREAKDGDIVVIDFEGYMDGKKFKGGSAMDYELTLGSRSFIEDLEKGISGMKVGEEKVIKVKFPDNYHEKRFAGKAAEFKVKLKAIKERVLPEVDDEFAKDAGYKNMKHMREEIEKELKKKIEEDTKNLIDSKLVQKIVEKLDIKAPRPLVEEEIDYKVKNFKEQFKRSYPNFDFDRYIKESNYDMNKLRESYRKEAESIVKARIVLEAIVKAENIEVSDDEVDKKIDEMAKNLNISVENARNFFSNEKFKGQLEYQIKIDKVFNILREKAHIIETEPAKNEDNIEKEDNAIEGGNE